MSVYSAANGRPITLAPSAPGSAIRSTFTVDWDDNGNELKGETIDISEWVIEPSGLSIVSESNTTKTATITVSGFEYRKLYKFTNQVTTTTRLTKEPISFYVQGDYRAPIMRAAKAPGADIVKAYLFDWSRVIGSSGVIDAAYLEVAPAGLSIVGTLVNGANVYVWLGGGTAGQIYTVTCTVDVNGIGQVDPAIMLVRCLAK